MKLLFLVLAMLAGMLSGCDCVQMVQGVVVDHDTQLPLAGVRVGKEIELAHASPLWAFVSDSSGNFRYEGISGGMLGCPDPELAFRLEGYEEAVAKFQGGTRGDTLRLRRLR